MAQRLLRRRPRRAPTQEGEGKAGHIPASLADEVKAWVIEGPAERGLDRADWTHEELADHLLKTKGIRTSRSAVQRFCSRIDIRLHRPTYRHERGDPVEQAAARPEAAEPGNGHAPGRSSC